MNMSRMTKEEALALKEGDIVYWHDPDNGLCSRSLTVEFVEDREDYVVVHYIDPESPDNGYIECPAHELEKDFPMECAFTVTLVGHGRRIEECWEDAMHKAASQMLTPGNLNMNVPDSIDYDAAYICE
jgi:hypothetical protein